MKISMDKLERSRVRLTVDVEADPLEDAINEAYRKTGKKISIPGFRKGKAPRRIIELNYGPNIFLDEAIDILLPRAYQEALRESEIAPVEQAQSEVKKAQRGEGATFVFEVDVYPEVRLGEYQGLAVEREIVDVTEEDITAVLEMQKERSAELVVVDSRSQVQEGDLAIIDFTGYIDGQPFSGGAAENQLLEIGSGQFIPGFEEQLVGAEVGETKEISVTFPEDYRAEHLAGKEAIFKVAVKELKEKSFPDIDDEFAKDISEFGTLDELKDQIRKNLEDDATRRTNAHVENKLLESIAANSEVEVPRSMVEHQAQYLANNFLLSLRRQGIDEQIYLTETDQNRDDLQRQFEPQALKQVVNDLLLESIWKQEGITVSDEEISARIEEYKESAEDSPEDAQNIAEYWESQRENLRITMQREKTIDFLVNKAQITEVPASRQEDQENSERQGEE